MILVVDDIPENVYSLKKVLEHNHFDVDTAFSGEEALKKILTKTYTLVVLDVQMPGIDGFEVAENIKGFKKAKDTAVIFLSANSIDTDLIVKGYNQGAIDYITKPVDPTVLLLKVKTVYDHYEVRQRNAKQHQQVNDLFEREKEKNTRLVQSIENISDLMQLAKIATWEFILNSQELNCSPEVYKLIELNPDTHPINLSFVFQHVNERELVEKFKDQEQCEFFQEINHKSLRIFWKKEHQNGQCIRIKGLVQDVSSFQNADQSLLSLLSG